MPSFNAPRSSLRCVVDLTLHLHRLIRTQEAIGRISYTCDMWSRGSLAGYMALTAHWLAIDPATGTLRLKARLVGFRHVPGTHSGDAEADVIWKIFNELGVVEKVYSIMIAVLYCAQSISRHI